MWQIAPPGVQLVIRSRVLGPTARPSEFATKIARFDKARSPNMRMGAVAR